MSGLAQPACERLFPSGADPVGPPSGWLIRLPDGEQMRWHGFYTGPVEFSAEQLAEAADRLLGLSLDEVAEEAAQRLRPATQDDGTGPCIILHSATTGLRSLQGDLADARNGRTPDDVATYVETRAVSLARAGDLVVGRTHTWKVAAELSGVEAVTIPGIDYYYLSHAMIQRLLDGGAEIGRLVDALRTRPDTVVRLYSLDREIQIVLLCLQRAAGIAYLYVDANSPEVAGYWNTKAPLHPRVEDVLDLVETDPGAMLTAETRRTPTHQRLSIMFERVPGYSVDTRGGSAEVVAERLIAAARLLRDRYGITTAALKPSEGGGGARISTGLSLSDEEDLRRRAAQLCTTGETFILEAQVQYAEVQMAGRRLRLAPSAHVRYGRLAEGITLQLTNGTSWQGNIFVDRAGCADAGITPEQYDTMLGVVEQLREAFSRRGQSFVTGGVDFAIGRVGGRFGDRVFVAVQDPNLSSHGAEYLRRFLDYLHADGGPRYAATKVLCPTSAGTLPAMRALEHCGMTAGSRFRVISAIPGRWGMIAAAAGSPRQAIEEVLAYEKDLIGNGLTFEAPPR